MPVAIRHLDTRDAGFESAFAGLQHWSAAADAAIESRVVEILAAVRARGDAALLEFTQRFDALDAPSMVALELGAADFAAAFEAITPAQREALQAAAARIRSYHERQLEHVGRSWSYHDADGTLLGQKVTPLDRVGIYVPGGKAAYPSSLLMNAIPAQVAGVGEIVMVVPTPRGERNALVLAAAHVAGVTRAFTIGGAQAVAALAYGTQTIQPVDKIVGPGNAYVAAAKRQVFGKVGIDMVAGPSEVLILADGEANADWIAADLLAQAVAALAYGTKTIRPVSKIVGPGNAYVAAAKRQVFGTVGIDMIAGPSEVLILADGDNDPDWLAADLLAQAEHDTAAQSILITDDGALADAVEQAVERQLKTLPRGETAAASWRDYGAVILVQSLADALPLVDRVAPEHLEIAAADEEALLAGVANAGAIFLGRSTPEVIGDYVGGSNHVLPTARSARFSSGLSVLDFMKRTSILKTGPEQLRALGPAAIALAKAEGLDAHARSVAIRLNL